MTASDQPFWRTKSLDQLDSGEWEALCDGCGQCCLLKLEDSETEELYHTRLACRLLDIGKCRCSDYENRHQQVADCVVMRADNLADYSWLPATCAYRLIDECKDLFWWHPLVSGRQETVHEAGISVRGWARSETGVPEARLDYYIVPDPSKRKVKGSD